ncbi:endonuclease/exonuclease/phosphatase family protein [Bremerella sp. T1]|uniref:endonuclease/exonuclease/phosphatase family protein n=1 Tax=Bremerella sp. TYQ1 TaxID=3119568 RepID=UPI001CCCCA0C|nr:endonuclease/exonuclease/phosphatase family protein [Bremerella volcania]UBM34745.1 endonuclease/exonuclease/phosphatase family protein [Bremerella volcania]
MRAFLFSSLAFLVGLFAATGCNVEQVLEQLPESPQTQATSTAQPGAALPGNFQPGDLQPGSSIRVASFNIQVFGQSKMGKPDVMQTLTQVVKSFDVVAVQELRSKEQDVIPRWLEMINADGSKWASLVGPRLGRTSSTEQYVFLYNTEKIGFVEKSDFTINDPHDLLHREPHVASFYVRTIPGVQPFTFTLINIHTDPDETDEELDALAEVFEVVRQANPNEDDVILLGDLNVDYTKMGMLGQIPGIVATVQGTPTNTRKTKSYDNIVFDQRRTTEFTGQAGVLDLMAAFKLTEEQALDVSDHLPVWATFSVTEAGAGPLAAAPGATAR